jgi:hypothetical protein
MLTSTPRVDVPDHVLAERAAAQRILEGICNNGVLLLGDPFPNRSALARRRS